MKANLFSINPLDKKEKEKEKEAEASPFYHHYGSSHIPLYHRILVLYDNTDIPSAIDNFLLLQKQKDAEEEKEIREEIERVIYSLQKTLAILESRYITEISGRVFYGIDEKKRKKWILIRLYRATHKHNL